MSNFLEKMAWSKEAFRLVTIKPQIKTFLERQQWTKDVFALLKRKVSAVSEIDESNIDYQYLQSVIKSELPNMNDPDIGNQLTDIFNRNSENSAFLSYVQQAVASYRKALISMSKQYIWGNV